MNPSTCDKGGGEEETTTRYEQGNEYRTASARHSGTRRHIQEVIRRMDHDPAGEEEVGERGDAAENA